MEKRRSVREAIEAKDGRRARLCVWAPLFFHSFPPHLAHVHVRWRGGVGEST